MGNDLETDFQLLVGLAVVPDPASRMAALRIMVCPVHHAAFRIPFIFAIKGNRVPCAQRINALRQIDVVGHQQRSPGCLPNNEALMAAAIVIVCQHLHDDALALELLIAAVVCEGLVKSSVATVSRQRRT